MNIKPKRTNEKKIVTLFFKEREIHLDEIKAEKLTVINRIYKTMNDFSDKKIKKSPIFNNLTNIISDEKILIIAYNNIKSNSGAGTKSINELTADGFSIKRIRKISDQLKTKTFKFSTIRKIYVPKPGKGIKKWTKKKLIQYGRPLGIPDFESKIVQEAIRIVLTAIYEPLFEKTNSFGFRTSYGAQDALILIEQQSQGMDLILEGDISKAFDSINHEILIKELSKYIIDKNFLNLIYDCCKSGIFNSLTQNYEFPCIGTPQGAILSPILWNIYMYKLDLYIDEQINHLINIVNEKQLIKKANPMDKRTKDLFRYKTTQPTKSNEYKYITNKLDKVKSIIFNTTHRNQINRLPILTQKKLQPLIEIKNKLENQLYKTSSINLARIKIRLIYVRYADDFIILTNSNKTIIQYIKNKIQSFLKYELKLNLSKEKTLITNLKNSSAKFLGYSLYKHKPKAARIIHLELDPKIKKRTTGGKISIGIDYKRVLNKFIEKRYIDKRHKVRSIGELTKKEDIDILFRFNEIIIGYAIYYLPIISRKKYFDRILYILESSFYHTLCHKNKTTINKIMKQHNKEVKFIQPNITSPESSKYHTIINQKNIDEKLGETIFQIKNNLINKTEQKTKIENILMEYRKGYWRTNASMSSACINCGTWQDIEYHHIKKLGDDKKKYKYSFDYNIRALNRKAIPVCIECHQKIHQGFLDTKTLKDLYDTRLAQYQNYIKIKREPKDKEE